MAKGKRGQPRKFKTEKEFIIKVKEYINECRDRDYFPNIAGFCVYCDMNRDTYYAQKDYYSDAFKKVEEIFEDGAINAKMNDAFKIFYMKNKFGYRDKVENLNVETNYEDYLKRVESEDEY